MEGENIPKQVVRIIALFISAMQHFGRGSDDKVIRTSAAMYEKMISDPNSSYK